MTQKPVPKSSMAEQELIKADKQFQAFDEQVQSMTMDRLNATPVREEEPQTKISQRDLAKTNDVYLKPYKTIGCRDKFNENYRKDYEFSKEYVQFIAENKEIVGETIDLWTRPFAGMPAEEWKVPVNKPVWGPRYLAEQIKRKYYHRLMMQENQAVSSDGNATYYGQMAVDTTVQRLDCHPVNHQKSIFMGASGF